MILHSEDRANTEYVQQSPTDSVIYSKTFTTEAILQIECKLTIYNLDEFKFTTVYFRHGFIVDTTATGTPTNDFIDSSFDNNDDTSIGAIINYDQTTSELTITLSNNGSYATEIACNWCLSIRVLKDV